jgi:hypothetical protein
MFVRLSALYQYSLRFGCTNVKYSWISVKAWGLIPIWRWFNRPLNDRMRVRETVFTAFKNCGRPMLQNVTYKQKQNSLAVLLYDVRSKNSKVFIDYIFLYSLSQSEAEGPANFIDAHASVSVATDVVLFGRPLFTWRFLTMYFLS